eukprot:TRINITY_DN2739_c0_g2_i3.p1 TRINITY_DN2739_c0_g2~~TRINITY_DN2739_c0_g2_i3.p1  ORF type:complete len:207 (+),score=-8.88 TRINITY_DN2739_c0_g2_i3:184-804(+)
MDHYGVHVLTQQSWHVREQFFIVPRFLQFRQNLKQILRIYLKRIQKNQSLLSTLYPFKILTKYQRYIIPWDQICIKEQDKHTLIWVFDGFLVYIIMVIIFVLLRVSQFYILYLNSLNNEVACTLLYFQTLIKQKQSQSKVQSVSSCKKVPISQLNVFSLTQLHFLLAIHQIKKKKKTFVRYFKVLFCIFALLFFYFGGVVLMLERW